MKKSIKIVFLMLLVILVFCGVFLIFKDKLLSSGDTEVSDLICSRDISNSTIDIKEEAEFVFKFDKQGIIRSYVEKRIYTFSTEREAQEQYSYFLEYSGANIKIDGNKIFESTEYDIVENQGYYGMSKKELKEYYENNFKYLCE